MKDESSYDPPQVRRAHIRSLGFDPGQLTSDEQRELLEIEARLRSVSERVRRIAVMA